VERALAEGRPRALPALVIERAGPAARLPGGPGFPEGNYLKFLLGGRGAL
jgi:hypothetical protein